MSFLEQERSMGGLAAMYEVVSKYSVNLRVQ